MAKWIVSLPDFSNGSLFNEETVAFILLILTLALSLWMTFKGYAVMKTLLLILTALWLGFLGIKVCSLFTGEAVFKLVFFVMFLFLGMCMVFFLNEIFHYLLRRLGVLLWCESHSYLMSAPLGAGLLCGCIWLRVFRHTPVCVLTFVVLTAAGLLYQHRHRHELVHTHTYDDIVRMKRPDLEDEAADGGRPATGGE